MKTAEEILKSKLDGKITFVNNPDYTFNKVIEAMEEYRLQSHPSPMSAEQRTNAMDVLKKHLKVDWIFSGDSGKAIIDAMEEWKRTPTITDGEQKYIDATKNKLCAICGYFCNNVHHANNWYDITPQSVTAMSAEQVEELDKYRKNAEDNYLTTPISVLRYITKMENLFATTPSVKVKGWEKFDVRKVIPFELKNERYVDINGNEITTSMLMKHRHDIYFDNGLLYID